MTKRAWAAVLGSLLLVGTGLALGASSLVGPAAAASSASAAARSAATAAATAPGCRPNSSTVTVDGYGSIEGQPDELTISLGVQTQASTAAVALRNNSAKANELISELEADGLTKQDLQTSGLVVQPIYTGPKQLITGYQVMNTVTVTLYDLAQAGKVIDDAAHAAGNAIVVNDIQFSIRNDTALLGEARAAAVRQAMGQAQLMASAAGVSLGPLCSLVDNSTQPQVPVLSTGAPAKEAAPSTPIESGLVQVTADVTAVYELRAEPTAQG